MKRFKAQSAFEFFMTYGWMIFIVVIIAGLLYYFSALPNLAVPQSCTFSSGVACAEFSAAYINATHTATVAVLVRNPNYYSIGNPSFTISYKGQNFTGSCPHGYFTEGSSFLCEVTVDGPNAPNSTLTGKMYLSALDCGLSNSTYAYNCTGAPSETYSGSIKVNTINSPDNRITVDIYASNSIAVANMSPDYIYAKIYFLGQYLKNASVSFTVNNTNFKIGKTTINTNSSGIAKDYAFTNQTGYVNVTAYYSGYKNSTKIEFVSP